MHMQIKGRTNTFGQVVDLPTERASNMVNTLDAVSPDFHGYEEQRNSMSDRRRRLLWMLEEIEREEQEYTMRRRTTMPTGGMRPWVGVAAPELDNDKPKMPNRLDALKTIGNYKRISSLNAEQDYKKSAVKSLFSVEEDL